MKGGRSGSRRSRDLLLVRPEQSGPENLLSLSPPCVYKRSTQQSFSNSLVMVRVVLSRRFISRPSAHKNSIGPPRFRTIRAEEKKKTLATDDFTDARQRGTKPPPPPRGSLSSLRRKTYRKVSKREGEREYVCVYACYVYVYVCVCVCRVCG